MRFIVYGAGGIGSVIGGHLFRHGYAVVLVGNPQHVDAIRARGLKLVTGDEPFSLPVPAVKTAEELLPFQADDVVLLCAKSQQTLRCLGQLRRAGAPRSLSIVCLQNSIWNEPLATRLFDHIYGAMIMIPAVFMTPGDVIHPITRRYGFIDIGRYPRGVDVLSEEIAAALARAGFSAAVHPDVMLPKAAKCLLNLGNALDAITDGRGDDGPLRAAVQREAIDVWTAAGIAWEPEASFRQRAAERYGVRKVPAGYEHITKRSSTWQSLARSTGNVEAEQLNGDVVTLGRQLHIDTPYNALLWRVADAMAAAGEPPGKYTAAELLAMVERAEGPREMA